jgi:hypothetical protein
MNKTDKEIIEQKDREVKAKIKSSDFLENYIHETLSQFAYRYFEIPNPVESSAQNTFCATYLEKGIKEAIKIKNPELRAGIGELVKRVSREQGPTILRELRLTFKERNSNHSGVCLLSARISFGHPEHNFSKGSFVEKTAFMKFEDEMHFRNTLARYLEEVCELFE